MNLAGLVIVLTLVAGPVANTTKGQEGVQTLFTDDVFGIVYQTFEDGSCRTATFWPNRNCRSSFYDIWCPSGDLADCIAADHPSGISMCPDEFEQQSLVETPDHGANWP